MAAFWNKWGWKTWTTNKLEPPKIISVAWESSRSLEVCLKLPDDLDGCDIIIRVSNKNTMQHIDCLLVAADKVSVDIEGKGYEGKEKGVIYSVEAASINSRGSQSSWSKEVVVENAFNENEILKKRLLASSNKVTNKELLAIHELQMDETYVDKVNQVRKMELGKSSHSNGIPEKVIMIVGETGCGKTTHLNSIVNYFYGVNYEDPFRFRIVTDSKEKSLEHNQAMSQTQWVTGYTFHHQVGCQQKCTLTLIDTPGFGHTGGIVNDQDIVERIKAFFTMKGGIDHIDAVGFVVKASSTRLTPTERYVFDSILSLFGIDIGDNIVIFVTFVDAKNPPVIATLKEAGFKYKSLIKFNNSAIFASPKDKDDKDEDDYDDDDQNLTFDQSFWKMGMLSFKKFFTTLMQLSPKSLTLTRNVLDEREALQLHVMGIRNQIKEGLGKLHRLEREIDVIKTHQSDIEKNRNFTYITTEQKVVAEENPEGQFVTNCIKCNITCHEPCTIANDNGKRWCAAMRLFTGKCSVCISKCDWKEHRNMPYRYKIVEEVVTKTSADLLNRYRDAQGKARSAQEMAQKIYEEYLETRVKVLNTMLECNKSLKRLREIALKANPLSEVDYIDKLIAEEERNKKGGYKKRMEQLVDIRELASRLQKVQSGDILKDLTENEERVAQKYKDFVDSKKAWAKLGSVVESWNWNVDQKKH